MNLLGMMFKLHSIACSNLQPHQQYHLQQKRRFLGLYFRLHIMDPKLLRLRPLELHFHRRCPHFQRMFLDQL